MQFLDKIKKWPEQRKKVFSISLAAFITLLIIILNSAINVLWPDNTPKRSFSDTKAAKDIGESINKMTDQNQAIFDNIFGANATDTMATEGTIEQDYSTSSSFSSTTNVVE